METVIYATVSFEATHYWADCPIEEVAYLRNEHRHIFEITAYKEVTHADRDVEFIVLGHRIKEFLAKEYPDHKFGGKSCEMIAEQLIRAFDLSACEVSEDGENGAVVKA